MFTSAVERLGRGQTETEAEAKAACRTFCIRPESFKCDIHILCEPSKTEVDLVFDSLSVGHVIRITR